VPQRRSSTDRRAASLRRRLPRLPPRRRRPWTLLWVAVSTCHHGRPRHIPQARCVFSPPPFSSKCGHVCRCVSLSVCRPVCMFVLVPVFLCRCVDYHLFDTRFRHIHALPSHLGAYPMPGLSFLYSCHLQCITLGCMSSCVSKLSFTLFLTSFGCNLTVKTGYHQRVDNTTCHKPFPSKLPHLRNCQYQVLTTPALIYVYDFCRPRKHLSLRPRLRCPPRPQSMRHPTTSARLLPIPLRPPHSPPLLRGRVEPPLPPRPRPRPPARPRTSPSLTPTSHR
jgi:hypothetical protein